MHFLLFHSFNTFMRECQESFVQEQRTEVQSDQQCHCKWKYNRPTLDPQCLWDIWFVLHTWHVVNGSSFKKPFHARCVPVGFEFTCREPKLLGKHWSCFTSVTTVCRGWQQHRYTNPSHAMLVLSQMGILN